MIFDFNIRNLNLVGNENKHHFESKENQFGTWNLTLSSQGFYRCNCLLSLVTTKAIVQELFSKIALTVKVRFSGNGDAYVAATISNLLHLPNKQIITFDCGVTLTQPVDVILQINTANIPVDVPPFTTSKDYFKRLFETEAFTDITIKTKGRKEIKAHSIILSQSNVFDAMLNKHDTKEARKKVINIQDVDHDVMKEFLRFIYCEETPKLNEMAKELLVLADRYEVPALVNVCGMHLIDKENLESVADILITADNMKIPKLKETATQMIMANRKRFIMTEGWKKMKETQKTLAFEITEKFFST